MSVSVSMSGSEAVGFWIGGGKVLPAWSIHSSQGTFSTFLALLTDIMK